MKVQDYRYLDDGDILRHMDGEVLWQVERVPEGTRVRALLDGIEPALSVTARLTDERDACCWELIQKANERGHGSA
jgi:hypothetical protein